jgi:hypothetical protein
MRRSVIRVLLGVTLAVSVTPLYPAVADVRVPVPGTDPNAIAVGDQYVFLIQRGDDEIVVFDHDLAVVGTLTDVPNVQRLVVHESTLYASATGANRIDAFDLTQPFPFPRRSFPTAPVTAPVGLAWAGGRLWFTGRSDTAADSSLHSMSAEGVVTVHDGLFAQGTLETSLARPDELIVAGFEQIARYSVAGGLPSLQASVQLGAGVKWAEWSPDGSELIVAHDGTQGEPGAWAFDGASLQRLRRIGPSGEAGAVSLDSDRALIVTGVPGSSGMQLWIYRVSDGTELSHHRLPTNQRAFADTLRISIESTFFVLGSGLYGSEVLSFPTDPQPASLTVKAPKKVPFGGDADIVVTLDSASSNRLVRIHTRIGSHDRELAMEGIVGAGGELHLTLRDLRATTTVIVEWEGDELHLPITTLERIGVEPIVRAALIGGFANDGNYRLYHAGDDPAMVVDVTPNLRGTFATFTLERFVDGRWRRADFLGNPLDRRSRAAVIIVNPRTGLRYRINCEIDPSDRVLGATTHWFYFSVV